MSGNSSPRRIQSVETALRIINLLRQKGGLTISEIADHIPLSMGAIHTQLATLRAHGVVIQKGKTYRLGPRLISFGNHVRNNMVIYKAGKEEVDLLAKKCGKNVFLTIEHKEHLYTIYKSFGGDPVATEYYRKLEETPTSDLHCGASGKAILSQYDRDKVEATVDELKSLTQNTITERQEFIDELETVRERGYAIVDGEKVLGIRAVGAPILGAEKEVLGALTVSAPKEHMKGKVFYEEIPELIMKTKSTVEVNIQANDYITR